MRAEKNPARRAARVGGGWGLWVLLRCGAGVPRRAACGDHGAV